MISQYAVLSSSRATYAALGKQGWRRNWRREYTGWPPPSATVYHIRPKSAKRVDSARERPAPPGVYSAPFLHK